MAELQDDDLPGYCTVETVYICILRTYAYIHTLVHIYTHTMCILTTCCYPVFMAGLMSMVVCAAIGAMLVSRLHNVCVGYIQMQCHVHHHPGLTRCRCTPIEQLRQYAYQNQTLPGLIYLHIPHVSYHMTLYGIALHDTCYTYKHFLYNIVQLAQDGCSSVKYVNVPRSKPVGAVWSNCACVVCLLHC